MNLRLRPKLLAELAPGTRVVSFNFDIGDWEPTTMIRVEVSGRTIPVYLWVVPARPSGSTFARECEENCMPSRG